MKTPRLLDGRLKLRHLVLLDALIRQGSVIGAATELHMAQPVATRGLQELEDILGVALFDRGPRGISPTVYGSSFAEYGRAVLAQLTEAGRHMVELAAAERGTAVVGTHLAGSNVLLPRAISTLKRQRPQVTVVVREAAPEALLVELASGRVDMIVGRITAPSDGQVERRKLYEEHIELVVRSDHPLARAAAIDLANLADFPWILPGRETSLRRELEEFFARHSIPLPTNLVEATSFLTVRQLLLSDDVIAALPKLLVCDDPDLACLSVSLEPIGHSVGVTLSTRALSPAANALLECLTSTAVEMDDSRER